MDVEMRSTRSTRRTGSPRSKHGERSPKRKVTSPKREAPVLDSAILGMDTQDEIVRNRLADYISYVEPMMIVKKIKGSKLLRLVFNPARGLYVGDSVSSNPSRIEKYTNYTITAVLIIFVLIFNLQNMRQDMLSSLFTGQEVCQNELNELKSITDRIKTRCYPLETIEAEVEAINASNAIMNQLMGENFDGVGVPLYPNPPTGENTIPATTEICMSPSNWMLRLFFPQSVCNSVMDQSELDTRAWYYQQANTAEVQPPPEGNVEPPTRNELFYDFVATYNIVAMIVNVAYLLMRHLRHVGISVSLPFKWRMFQFISGPSKTIVTLIITCIILADFLILMIPELGTIIWPQIEVLLDPCMSMTPGAANMTDEAINHCKRSIMLSQTVQIVEYDSISIANLWRLYRADGHAVLLDSCCAAGEFSQKVSCAPGCSVQEMMGQFVNNTSNIRLGYIIMCICIFFFEAIICSFVRDLIIILRPHWLPFTLFIDPHLGEKTKDEEITQFMKVVRLNRIVWTVIKGFIYFIIIIWFAADSAT